MTAHKSPPREQRQSRAEKAARIRSVIRIYWRTHSDRQMAELDLLSGMME